MVCYILDKAMDADVRQGSWTRGNIVTAVLVRAVRIGYVESSVCAIPVIHAPLLPVLALDRNNGASPAAYR